MPSFDVVSKVDLQEVDNAVNNATKEIENRYDFRGTDTELNWNASDSTITMTSNAEGRLQAALDVLQSKMLKRNLPIQTLKAGEVKPAGGARVRQEFVVQQGIEQDVAKKIVKDIKATKIKVQASIQGDQLRVTGKNRDDLQEIIALLKGSDYGLPLQYINFRD